MVFSGLKALPAVAKLEDAALYVHAVEPFWPELYELPKRLAEVRSLADLQAVYLSHNPFVESIAFSIALGVVVLVVAEVTRNYSQIDRLWSILPNFYNAHYCLWAHLAGLPTRRLDLVVLATTVWSARLTFNYWRRGGYTAGSEDYRWPWIRERIGMVAYTIFAWTFISFVQSTLLAVVASPTYVLLNTTQLTRSAVDGMDYLFAQIILVLVAVEYTADQAQWDYHKAKHEYQRTAKVPANSIFTRADLDRGFLANGLFALSRHPNYVCEIGVWFTLFAWGCYASQTTYNWTLAPFIAYLAIFLGSTPLTEYITSKKYAEYKHYQSEVGMFLPNPFSVLRGGYKGPPADAKAVQKKKR